MSAQGPPGGPPSVPAWRLTTTLAVAGAVAGLLIVLVYQWAEPRIEAHRARVLEQAIHEVLGDPARIETLYVVGGRLLPDPPAGDPSAADRVWAGYDEAGRRIGFAIPAAEPGFQDVIRLLFGYDPERGEVLGMRVLESRETPGLGDRIVKDSTFVAGFEGALAPLEGVKAGGGGRDPHEVDMITGATISSRTVIAAINERLEALGPSLGAGADGSGP